MLIGVLHEFQSGLCDHIEQGQAREETYKSDHRRKVPHFDEMDYNETIDTACSTFTTTWSVPSAADDGQELVNVSNCGMSR